MNTNSSISSSNFLQENFFTAEDIATEYFELPTQSRFNKFYKIKRFGRWFILKGLKPEYASDVLYVSLLKKEFELSSELNHPNIVTTILKEDNPRVGPAILMEYIDGMTLDEFLATNPTSVQRHKVLMQLLDAMQYFHSKQIIHRDLKPSNILITRNGFNVKIIDFGLADSDNYAIFKQPAGTISYAAPEQMKKNEPIDCRADIYSFGLILKEIFPNKYHSIVHRSTQLNPINRFANVEQIIKTINLRTQISRFLLPAILSLLLIVISLTNIFYHSTTSSNSGYSDLQKQFISQAYFDIDKLYTPYIDSLEQGKFQYREFASFHLYLYQIHQQEIHQVYQQQIPPDSSFYSIFMSSFTGYVSSYYYKASSIIDTLPSFFTEHQEGRLSYSEFEKLYTEYTKLTELYNK